MADLLKGSTSSHMRASTLVFQMFQCGASCRLVRRKFAKHRALVNSTFEEIRQLGKVVHNGSRESVKWINTTNLDIAAMNLVNLYKGIFPDNADFVRPTTASELLTMYYLMRFRFAGFKKLDINHIAGLLDALAVDSDQQKKVFALYCISCTHQFVSEDPESTKCPVCKRLRN